MSTAAGDGDGEPVGAVRPVRAAGGWAVCQRDADGSDRRVAGPFPYPSDAVREARRLRAVARAVAARGDGS